MTSNSDFPHGKLNLAKKLLCYQFISPHDITICWNTSISTITWYNESLNPGGPELPTHQNLTTSWVHPAFYSSGEMILPRQ